MQSTPMLLALGAKLRKQRRRMGFSLDDLMLKSGISKAYLSLIETGQVSNPPSDQKLAKLEEVLELPRGRLVSEAHLCRTPKNIRAMLAHLMSGGKWEIETDLPPRPAGGAKASTGGRNGSASRPSEEVALIGRPLKPTRIGVDLDDAYVSGVLHQLVETTAANIVPMTPMMATTSVINSGALAYEKMALAVERISSRRPSCKVTNRPWTPPSRPRTRLTTLS